MALTGGGAAVTAADLRLLRRYEPVLRFTQAGLETPDHALWLRFVHRPLDRRQYRAWRRDPGRARSAPRGSRFAAVGLLARLIDAALRLSLLLRGRVPGGTAAAAEQSGRARAAEQACPYYGRVVRDRGFIVLQYWFSMP
jgi:hypothetical protein